MQPLQSTKPLHNQYSVNLPKVMLNVDLNGSIIVIDTQKNVTPEYMIISALAEATFAEWDHKSGSMSFKQYVLKVALPGDETDQIKLERQNMIASFLDWLKEHSHPLLESVREDYHKIIKKFTDPISGEIKFTVFPSFYLLLKKLRNLKIPFIVALRTYGSDIPLVVNELKEHPDGIRITRFAKFEDTTLKITGGNSITKIEEVFDTFLNSEEHFAIEDDHAFWIKHKKSTLGAKPFFYDSMGARKAKNVTSLVIDGKKSIHNISIFLDDNIRGKKQDIVRPCEINGKTTSTKELYGRFIFKVDTKAAILNDNYFIDLLFE